MIYEIFKTASDAGMHWGHFALATLVSLYVIYVCLWVSGWLSQQLYSYVQDGEATIANFMRTVFYKVLTPDATPPAELKQWADGWYTAAACGLDGYWAYYRVLNGEVDKRQDADPRGIVFNKPPNFWEYEALTGPIARSHGKEKYGTSAFEEGADAYLNYWFLFWHLPLPLTAVLLFIDAQPLAAVVILGGYITLRLARTAVRLGKKINKHVADTTVHAQPTGDTDA